MIALGLAVFAASYAFYASAPEDPETKQVDLTVLSEKADGRCTVAWSDPYAHKRRTGPYACDPERDPLLKAPQYDPDSGHGWETGWMVTEGSGRGDLWVLGQDDAAYERAIDRSDDLIGIALPLLLVGVVGGNVRSLYRLSGASPSLVRRARRVEEAARRLGQDHARAVEAVRTAWEPLRSSLVDEALGRVPIERLRRSAGRGCDAKELRRCGVRTARDVLEAGTPVLSRLPGVQPGAAERLTAGARKLADDTVRAHAGRPVLERPGPQVAELLNALHVLVDVGPQGRADALRAGEFADGLGRLTAAAAPAAGRRSMLRADAGERFAAKGATARLRPLLAGAAAEADAARFAQLSIDLLRGPDADRAGVAARADYERRPTAYAHLLTELVVPGPDRPPAP
ncbi:hypothetical protein GTW43_06935 [Streptomyces sp. SID5785]|nr:hypothetical protein [Streptomyces sp. SID5785]MZD04817.1 hypothetical protein [Streptomyces sp. SID5785]